MKVVAALSLALATSARAFAPASQNKASSASSALRMADQPFGAAPFFPALGQTEWKKFTTELGSEDTGTFLRAAEIKHGRSAMIATVGYALQKFGITFDKISPHEYLSVTQNVKFADLAKLSPIEAAKAIPPEGLAQIFCAIAAIEIYELTHANGAIKYGERVAPGWQSGGLTGDLGFNPLKIEVTDRRRLVEIQNGRAAMFAIIAWTTNEYLPGSVPIPFPWS